MIKQSSGFSAADLKMNLKDLYILERKKKAVILKTFILATSDKKKNINLTFIYY